MLKRNAFVGWNYTVSYLYQDEDATVYNSIIAAAPPNTVVFVGQEIDSTYVSTKLRGQKIGMVIEEKNLNANMGFTLDDTTGQRVSSQLMIVNSSHYITQDISFGFGATTATITAFTSTSDVTFFWGDCPNAQILGMNPVKTDRPNFIAVEKGSSLVCAGCGVAQGRRVVLPFGQPTMDFGVFTNASKLLIKRSLEWCNGANL